MKRTWKLYRQSPTTWMDLPYKEALLERKKQARLAMDYYRIRKDEENYLDSEKARDHNIQLIEELENELLRESNEQSDGKEEHY